MKLRRKVAGIVGALILGATATVAIASPASAAVSGPFRLKVDGTSMCMDVKDVSYANGAYIQLWDCLPNQWNQQWYLYEVPNRFQTYQIVSRHSGKCLDLIDGLTAWGTQFQQWDCLGYNQLNQLFQVVYNFNSTAFTLSVLHDWKEVNHQGTFNGSLLYQGYTDVWWQANTNLS